MYIDINGILDYDTSLGGSNDIILLGYNIDNFKN